MTLSNWESATSTVAPAPPAAPMYRVVTTRFRPKPLYTSHSPSTPVVQKSPSVSLP